MALKEETMAATRRGFLRLGALSALGWAMRPRTALGALSVRMGCREPLGDVLVSIFLRGGADGLSLVAAYGDDDYYRNRPTLVLTDPRDGRAAAGERLVDLDGFFGLHPALSPLLPLYQAGQLAIVHACGSGDQTRSHFEAMATVERGLFRGDGPASGWLARHLETTPWENASPLRAVALGEIIPETLRGASHTTAMRTVADLSLHVPFAGREASITQTLTDLYRETKKEDNDLLCASGQEALAVLQTLRRIDPARMRPALGAVYPADEFGQGLHQVACLMKSGVGLEAACLDHGGYDTHVVQGTAQGLLSGRLQSLGASLSAFVCDLGRERWARTTIVVYSEFGRRVAENSGGGTDHGRGGVMLVLGGRGVLGGRVHGVWPGLNPAHLEGPGDLPVTTDYRDVLAEVIQSRLQNPHVASIFPGLAHTSVGVAHA